MSKMCGRVQGDLWTWSLDLQHPVVNCKIFRMTTSTKSACMVQQKLAGSILDFISAKV